MSGVFMLPAASGILPGGSDHASSIVIAGMTGSTLLEGVIAFDTADAYFVVLIPAGAAALLSYQMVKRYQHK
jgi:hypothetical protein